MTGFLLILALLVCPALYLALCLRMRWLRIPRPPYVSYFFLFGTVGGWVLALAVSPSGLAASCIVFLLTFAPLSVVGCSLYLALRSERTRYHRVALWGGFAYPALLVMSVLIVALLGK